MAVSYVSATPAVDSGGFTSSVDVSIDFGSGANRCIIAFGSIYGGAQVTSINVVGGASFSLVRATYNAAFTLHHAAYRLVNPPTGVQTVRLTCSDVSFPNLHVLVFSGVDQTTPIHDHTGVQFDSNTQQVLGVASTSDGMVMAAANTFSNSHSYAAPHTERTELANTGGHNRLSTATAPGTGGTVNATANFTELTNYSSMIAVSLKAASASPFALGSPTLALTGDIAIPSGRVYILPVVWRVPTGDADGTVRRVWVVDKAAGTLIKQGNVTAAGGNYDLPDTTPTHAIGTKLLAHLDNWNENTSSTDIRGGQGLATLTDT